MIKKTRYQQLPTLLKGGATALVIAASLTGCAASDPLDTDNVANAVAFSAAIGDAKEVIVSRATNDGKGIVGTYSSFADGVSFGVYADKGFALPMENFQVTKGIGDTWSNGQEIQWNETADGDVALTAYYPYSSSLLENYSLLSTTIPDQLTPVETGDYRLKDVLVASRKSVSHNNPALFLTFTHRFALLRIKLGNGFDGFKGKVKATMEKGIETTVDVATAKGVIILKDDNALTSAKTFVAPTESGNEYYVLVPADEAARKVVSLTLGSKVIDNMNSDNKFNMPELSTQPNTIYTLTAHIIDGVPVIRVVGIEAWADAEYLGIVKAKPGIYTEEELKEFGEAYNNESDPDRDKKLSSFGEKKDDKWTIYLQNNLYLTELDDLRTEDINESEYTAAIVSSFSDIFAGQGYTINGLSIAGGNGLFGTLKSGAQVNDLILTDASVTNIPKVVTKANALTGTGILVGVAGEGSAITNCHIFGTSAATGTSNTGGLVGEVTGKSIINRSSSFAIVTGPLIGGFCAGGLVGKADSDCTITNSFAKGWVIGETGKVGPLVGHEVPNLSNCYATVTINGTLQSIDYHVTTRPTFSLKINK